MTQHPSLHVLPNGFGNSATYLGIFARARPFAKRQNFASPCKRSSLLSDSLTWNETLGHDFFLDLDFCRLQSEEAAPIPGIVPQVLDLVVERQQVPEELVVDVGQREKLPPELGDLQGKPDEGLAVVVEGSRPGMSKKLFVGT